MQVCSPMLMIGDDFLGSGIAKGVLVLKLHLVPFVPKMKFSVVENNIKT